MICDTETQNCNTTYLKEYMEDLLGDLNVDLKAVIKKIAHILNKKNIENLSQKELDNLLSEELALLAINHLDYSILAARVLIRTLHKSLPSFSKMVENLYKASLLAEDFYQNVYVQKNFLDDLVDLSRDYNFNFFSFKTLEKSYLIRLNNEIQESPQYMYMRVAVALGKDNQDKIKDIYHLLSEGYISFGTPTYFNAGCKKQQLSSCFLVAMEEDSLKGIYSTLDKTAQISKYAGGIGIHIHQIRAKGTQIKGTNGISNGILPMLKVFNESSKYVDQGGGKRKGSIAVYLEPWHLDLDTFLEMRNPRKAEDLRCLDLFTALWIPDIFMERVAKDEYWTLFCPSEVGILAKIYGEEFNQQYCKFELDPNIQRKKRVLARDIMKKIIVAQVETGTPYLLYKDAANRKSNQKNVGTIQSSNLCAEIIEYSDPDNTAVCNLGSLALPRFVEKDGFNFKLFEEHVRKLTVFLNDIIDVNYYPIQSSKKSNQQLRPIGIGVQGLADVFFKLSLPYDSPEARSLNRKISEHLYYAALDKSCNLAEQYGSYEAFPGSPASQGLLQFDLWGESSYLDFSKLKNRIKKYGLRNSLLVAYMPTASTAQILGNTESFEPQTSNIYKRQTLSGEYIVVNKYLVEDLMRLNLWNSEILAQLISNQGSVLNLDVPESIKKVYRTVWEIKQKALIDMSADRAPFICHSQSMNLWFKEPDSSKIYSAHMYAWEKGLKTGVYYLRSQPAKDAAQMTASFLTKMNLDEEQHKHNGHCVSCHA